MKAIKYQSISLLSAFAIIAITYALFTPYWQTNDDVGMSMIAHGFGLSMYQSSNLIFSNIIWGSIINIIPSFFGVLGYSWATIFIIFVGLFCTLNLFIKKYSIIIAIILVSILFLRPIVYPQFTILAGISFIIAFLFYYKYALTDRVQYLAAFCLFCFLSSIIRTEQFILMCVVAIPIFVEITKRYDIRLFVAFALLAMVIILSYIINVAAYEQNEWHWFMEFRRAVSSIVNFNAAGILTNNQELLASKQVSVNDIRLLQSFFFADKNLIPLETLSELSKSVKFNIDFESGIINLGYTALFLLNINIVALTVLSFALIIISPKKEIIISWLIFMIALVIMSFIDRPAVERVIYPVFMLLIIYNLLENNEKVEYEKLTILPLLLIINVLGVWYDNYQSNKISEKRFEYYKVLSKYEPVFILGADLPYESFYPVLAKDLVNSPRIITVASFMWAPFSVGNYQANNGGDFKNKFVGDGVIILVNDISRLNLYCSEHYNGMIEVLEVIKEPYLIIKVKCHDFSNHTGYHELADYVKRTSPSVIYVSEVNANMLSDFGLKSLLFPIKVNQMTLSIESGDSVESKMSIKEVVKKLLKTETKSIKVSESKINRLNINDSHNKIVIMNKIDDGMININEIDLTRLHLFNRMEFGSYVVYSMN